MLGIKALPLGHHHRLGPLDKQQAQIPVTALGDDPTLVLAAAGVLTGRETPPRLGLVLFMAIPIALRVARGWCQNDRN